MIALMQPGSAREWTTGSSQIWNRLDAARPVERELLLKRIESLRFGFDFVRSFCRLDAAAPADSKRRLLARWQALGAENDLDYRPMEHIPLYLALARMGLKAEAGKVDQHYHGSDYRGIWAEVTPSTPASICDLDYHGISSRFRSYRK